jgi:hypothetical protein
MVARCGCVVAEDPAEAEESARKRDVTTMDDLTPQELRIAELVAAGASNREVAAQLFPARARRRGVVVSPQVGWSTAVAGSPSTASASASTSLSSMYGMLSALAKPSAPANWSVRSR